MGGHISGRLKRLELNGLQIWSRKKGMSKSREWPSSFGPPQFSDGPLSTLHFWPSTLNRSVLTVHIGHESQKLETPKSQNGAIWKLKTMILNYFLKLNFYIFFSDEMNETRLWTSPASWNRDSDRNIIHFRYDRISFELFKRLRVPSYDSKIISEVA